MFKKANVIFVASMVAAPAMLALTGNNAVAESNVQFNATVKAVCSLTVDPSVDLGDIAITEFSGKNAGEGISGYDKTFTVTANCSGTNAYKLTMTPTKASSGCLESTSEELAFCLYNSGGTKINMVEAGATLEKQTSAGAENIRVVPARATKAPTAGEHSGTMTVTIMPL